MASYPTQPDDTETAHRLSRLRELVHSCWEHANPNGERFNIFSILGVQRDENRTHTRFLAEILDPSGRHGEGKRFLQEFINGPLGRGELLSDPVRVTRELPTAEGRRIDLAIETPELLVGIEVKIDAEDQWAQLRDYHKELEQRARPGQSIRLAYLTLHGNAPSDNSLAGLPRDQVLQLSFADSIHTWIARCSAPIAHKPELSHALLQYARLLENLTGSEGSATAMIAKHLANNSDDLRAALEIERSLPQAKARIMFYFWHELSDRLATRLGAPPTVYGSPSLESLSYNFFNASRGVRDVGMKYPIVPSESGTICLYIHLYSAIHYGLRLDDPSGNPVANQETRAWFRCNLNDGNAKADKHTDWLVCYYHDPRGTDERLNFAEFSESVVDLLDPERRKAILDQMVEHQVGLVDLVRSLWGQESH